VPDGNELIPATPEQVEVFREWERERIAAWRLNQWQRAEQRRLHPPVSLRARRTLGQPLAAVRGWLQRLADRGRSRQLVGAQPGPADRLTAGRLAPDNASASREG
jgi:hypothetical protein